MLGGIREREVKRESFPWKKLISETRTTIIRRVKKLPKTLTNKGLEIKK